MKIVTGISKEKMLQIANEATNKIPSEYHFKISIDNEEYEATLYCYVIFDERTARNPMTGILEYSQENRRTINRIEVYNFNNFEKMVELQRQDVFFKVDEEDYYLEESERWITQENKLTFIAKKTNRF